MRLVVAGLATAALAATAAPPALGSYLTLQTGFDLFANPDTTLVYTAADGEANQLTVARRGELVVFGDPAVQIRVLDIGRAPAACPTGSGSHEVLCTPPSAPASGRMAFPGGEASVLLRDGNDSATVGGLGLLDVDGGPGDDRLSASGSTGLTLTSLEGGAGRDTLLGSRRDDVLDGGPGADRIDGAAGNDTVEYSGRFSPVTVDLRRRGPQGRSADGDTVLNVENVAGGSRRNRLIGNDAANALLAGGGGPNVLIGEAGGDHLTGGDAADRLYGGPGRDQLEARGGNDYLSARDGQRDVVDCGAGRDTAVVDRLDRVVGCERVLRG